MMHTSLYSCAISEVEERGDDYGAPAKSPIAGCINDDDTTDLPVENGTAQLSSNTLSLSSLSTIDQRRSHGQDSSHQCHNHDVSYQPSPSPSSLLASIKIVPVQNPTTKC